MRVSQGRSNQIIISSRYSGDEIGRIDFLPLEVVVIISGLARLGDDNVNRSGSHLDRTWTIILLGIGSSEM